MVLPWCTRIRIALGAAQGLAYLHEEAQKPVIYRDFKASNILLDAVIISLPSNYTQMEYYLSIIVIVNIPGLQREAIRLWTRQRWA